MLRFSELLVTCLFLRFHMTTGAKVSFGNCHGSLRPATSIGSLEHREALACAIKILDSPYSLVLLFAGFFPPLCKLCHTLRFL